MLKGGIFIDGANLSRCGGWKMDFRVLWTLVEAQGVTIVRANNYLVVDKEREATDAEWRDKKQGYRDAVRRAGFHVVAKTVRRYKDEEGNETVKANADVDMAVDALLQSEQLDYVLLGTGDGDFLRLVRALQNRGKRVDLLAFSHVNGELKREVDYHFNGYLMPNLLRDEEGKDRKHRGILRKVSLNGDYGFITYFTGYRPQDETNEAFLHITKLEEVLNNEQFTAITREKDTYIEFDTEKDNQGRTVAVNARIHKPLK